MKKLTKEDAKKIADEFYSTDEVLKENQDNLKKNIEKIKKIFEVKKKK